MHSLVPIPEKGLRRVSRREWRTLHAKPRRVVVTLLPSDEIEFRELRGRSAVRAPIAELFRYAVRLYVTQQQTELL